MNTNKNTKLDTKSLFKWLILFVFAAFSVYVVMPPKEKIRLGLDLQGGTSFTVQIDEARLRADMVANSPDLEKNQAELNRRVAEKMRDADARTLGVLRKRIDALGTQEPIIAAGQNHRILIQIPGADAEQSRLAEESVKSAAFLTFRLVHKQNDTLVAKFWERDRIPEGFRKSELAGKRGNGGPCLIRDSETYATLAAKPEFSSELGRFSTPSASYEFLLQEAGTDRDGYMAFVPCYVSRAESTTITGDSITNAKPLRDPTRGIVTVSLSMNSEGSKKFAKITGDYFYNDQTGATGRKNTDRSRRQLAIVLDDIVRSAPTLNSEIRDGNAEISGSFDWKSAVDLSNVLNAGSLSAPIRIIEKRSVSPSLGQDAIQRGTQSALIGVSLVLVFMVIYYTYCGVVADIALLLNMLLCPAGMILASGLLSVFMKDGTGSGSIIQLPVLTLPGIAGLVLSIGMAVDANVLIFERMREEFRLGKTARGAVAAGYDRAFLAIFDSNLTTLIVGIILFIFGSGPIRGFAVTLCAGIIVSMFTALVVTRLIFDMATPETRIKPYKMLQLISPNVNFDFLKYAKPTMIISATIIVVTLSIFFYRAFKSPSSVMAVDFTGGVALTYDSDKPLDVEAMRAVIEKTGVTDQVVQSTTGADGVEQMLVKTSTEEIDGVQSSQLILKVLQDANPTLNVKLADEERVGSQIGSELKKDAVWSIVISLIAIIIYVSVRFELGFAIGGVVALAHDALITLGIFTICGNQVSLTTVAALLTIVGYSINDTIVIFDRIREDLRRDAKTDFLTLVRSALNQTLARTILTTASTLLVVLALYLFGGAAMHDFAFALLIGMIAGTYSTLFLATPVMVAWYRGKRPVAVVEAPAAE